MSRPPVPNDGRPAVPPPAGRALDEVSAGGLIPAAGRGRAALIARYGRHDRPRWSSPAGHRDTDQTIQEAAIREVEEETGSQGRVLAPPGRAGHRLAANRRNVRATTVGGALCHVGIEVVRVPRGSLGPVPARLVHADERRLVPKVPGPPSDTA